MHGRSTLQSYMKNQEMRICLSRGPEVLLADYNCMFEMLNVKLQTLYGRLQPGGVRIEFITTAKPVVS